MLNRSEIERIARETAAELAGGGGCTPASGCWMCDTAEEAIANAKASQQRLHAMGLEERGRFIAAMRAAALKNAEYLAELAHSETKYGSVAHKILKNQLAANKTPGIEDLVTQALRSGANGVKPWRFQR